MAYSDNRVTRQCQHGRTVGLCLVCVFLTPGRDISARIACIVDQCMKLKSPTITSFDASGWGRTHHMLCVLQFQSALPAGQGPQAPHHQLGHFHPLLLPPTPPDICLPHSGESRPVNVHLVRLACAKLVQQQQVCSPFSWTQMMASAL